MLLERAELVIKEGLEDGFSAAMKERGVGLLASVPGVMSVNVGRGVENPGKFLLLVEWENMSAHTIYNQGPVCRFGSRIDRPILEGRQHGTFSDVDDIAANAELIRTDSMTCERRDFLKGGVALSIAAVMPPGIGKAAETGYAFNPQPEAWRRFEVTTQIDILAPQAMAQAWIPLPSIIVSDWIHPLGDEWKVSDGKATPLQIGRYGIKMLHVEWSQDSQAPSVQIISRVATRDRSVDFAKSGKPKALSAAERSLFLSPTELIPTDGIVKHSADQIVAGAKTAEEKARRLYEWVVANTFRDPKTPGCGVGDISSMLRTGDLSGKCADLNALYVGMARACGIPARDLYGIRVAPSKFGYKSLGANSAVITKSQHCRAEVYLSQWGWVPADPADVRKVVLEEPPGNLKMNDPKVEAAHKTLFGSWETNWIAYNHGHDISLPGSKRPPINFLMYPQAEVGGQMRDCLDADTFKYVITSKEVA